MKPKLVSSLNPGKPLSSKRLLHKRYASKHFYFQSPNDAAAEIESQKPELYLQLGSPQVSLDRPQLALQINDPEIVSPSPADPRLDKTQLRLSPQN